MSLCEVCKSIEFERLPSEDEAGVPHQPDLDSLEESSENCCLCRVIFRIASELSTIICNQRTGNDDQNPGGEVHISSIPGRSGMYLTHFGNHGSDEVGFYTTGGSRGYAGPEYTHPRKVFPGGNNIRPWLFGNWWASASPSRQPQLIGFGVRLGTGPKPEDGVGNSADLVHLHGTSFRFRTEVGMLLFYYFFTPLLTIATVSPLADIIPGRIRATDPSSRFALFRVRKWLRECNEQHMCMPQDGPLPTRVLDLGEGPGSHSITLFESLGRHGRYLALSHCWGLSSRIKTKKRTIEAHKRGISFSTLPKTFQDAIATARMLSIRYLWIDTLCIIQDDVTDWEIEASKMGEVYSKSYLTIAASSSMDDADGVFPSMAFRLNESKWVSSDTTSHGRPGTHSVIPDMYPKEGSVRPTYLITDDSALFTYTTAGEQSGIFLSPEWMPCSRKSAPLIYRIGEFGLSFDPLLSEPLSERGWTLQERLLSPRSIHYGTHQMYWECQQCILAEDGAYFEPRWRLLPMLNELVTKELSDALTALKISDHNAASLSGHDKVAALSWRLAWVRLVEAYTSRKLTHDQDKLPALAGLVRKISTHISDTYLAGLWRSSILETLNWRVFVDEPDVLSEDRELIPLLKPQKSEVRSPSRYRSPSWSWAAIDARVHFTHFDKPIMAKFVDCELIPASSDPFGRLQSGWIKLAVRFFPILCIPKISPSGYKMGSQRMLVFLFTLPLISFPSMPKCGANFDPIF